MTKAEFVKFLNKNFEDDEEVNFLYYDDGMDTRGTVKGIQEHTETHVDYHYEYRKDGKWVRWNEEKDERKNRFHITCWDGMMGRIDHDDVEDWWREVTDNEEKDIKKVIEIA